MAECFHVPLIRHAGWRLKAALDVTPSRRAKALELGVPRACATMAEFLATGIDAALVSTHSSVRLDAIRPLAKAGKHLLIEKPLATTTREARTIIDLCDRAGVLCSVYHNRRWDPDFLRVRQLVESGLIGEIVRVENRLFEKEPATRFGCEDFRQEWRVTVALGGGTLLDWGPHLMDQALTLMDTAGAGRVVAVMADVRHVRHGDADDHAMIELVFENGAHALVGKSDVCPVGPGEKWIVVGNRGSLVADWDSARAADGRGRTRTLTGPTKTVNLHQNFREAVEGRAELLVTARQSLRTVRIFDAARRSVHLRRSVAVSI